MKTIFLLSLSAMFLSFTPPKKHLTSKSVGALEFKQISLQKFDFLQIQLTSPVYYINGCEVYATATLFINYDPEAGTLSVEGLGNLVWHVACQPLYYQTRPGSVSVVSEDEKVVGINFEPVDDDAVTQLLANTSFAEDFIENCNNEIEKIR